MAGVPSQKNSDHCGHESQKLGSKTVKYQGVVKFYKEEKGYGFLKVLSSDYPDVFFHVKQLHRIGVASVQVGDMFTFHVEQTVDKDSKVKHRARGFEKHEESFDKLLGEENKHQQTGNYCDKNYNSGNSGSYASKPNAHKVTRNPNYEVTSYNGEIVTRDLNKVGCKNQPLAMSQGRMKIGPPCRVPAMHKGPVVVSATGHGSAELAPCSEWKEDPEITKLLENIQKKRNLMRSLKLDKLPDGGRRLRDEISVLELKLQNLAIKKNTVEKKESCTKTLEMRENIPVCKNVSKPEKNHMSLAPYDMNPKLSMDMFTPVDPLSYKSLANQEKTDGNQIQTKLEPLGTRIRQMTLDQYDMGPMQFSDGPLYGGRMTSTRLTEVRNVTKRAIEDLHKSLETRPEPEVESPDPQGLQVTLMKHQKQALAWLIWREKQTLSGGILADDMGLGKTLTMISLILKQRETEEKDNEEVEDVDDPDDEHDSDVISIEDDEEDDTKNAVVRKKKLSKPKQGKGVLVGSESTLIVAPASLLFHWEKEIRNRCKRGLVSIHLFHGASREKEPSRLAEFDVVITTYEIVRRCKGAEKKGDDMAKSKSVSNESTLMQIKWRRIILDEAHQIKNFKSLSSEAACQLQAQTRWALSGTPVQNNLTDMYAMLKFLHCCPFDEYKVWKHQVDNKSAKGQERLKILVSCIVLRREKSQCGLDGKPLVNLPKRTFATHKLKLNDVEREVYNKLQTDSQDAFRKFQEKQKQTSGIKLDKSGQASGMLKSQDTEKMTATTLLVMLLRLRQCCGHLSLLKESFDPELLSNEKREMALEDMFQSMDINKTPVKMTDISFGDYETKEKAKYFEKSYCSGKVEFVMDELNKLRFEKPEDKCVIVSQWTSMLEVVAYHLHKAQISFVIIKGNVPAKKRMDMVDDFNRNPVNPKVILLSLQAGGVGLNLIGGNHLYLLDMHWNPALESQAFDRIYRVGQTKPVFVHKFVVGDTVEERILKLQEHKLSIAKAVMVGAGVEDRKKLTLQDMKLLFGI